MFTWLAVPEGLDVLSLRAAATAAQVAYVPGSAFYVGDDGRREMRLSYSSLSEPDLEEAGRRLAGVIASAMAFT
jgi:DNA-binding transcriptional MocR family regulator